MTSDTAFKLLIFAMALAVATIITAAVGDVDVAPAIERHEVTTPTAFA